MSSKIRTIGITRRMLWRNTKMYLAHYRMTLKDDMDLYNRRVSKLTDLYRNTEFLVVSGKLRITKLEYIAKIKELEKD